jgi:hypothetical protein
LHVVPANTPGNSSKGTPVAVNNTFVPPLLIQVQTTGNFEVIAQPLTNPRGSQTLDAVLYYQALQF